MIAAIGIGLIGASVAPLIGLPGARERGAVALGCTVAVMTVCSLAISDEAGLLAAATTLLLTVMVMSLETT